MRVVDSTAERCKNVAPNRGEWNSPALGGVAMRPPLSDYSVVEEHAVHANFFDCSAVVVGGGVPYTPVWSSLSLSPYWGLHYLTTP